MKDLFLLTALFVIPFLSYGQGCPSKYNTTITSPDLRQWNSAYTYSILNDDFNGSSLNSSIWSIRTGCVRNIDEEAQHYKNSSQNISVSDSSLKLTARKETTLDWIYPKTGNPVWGTRNYTSGEIYTSINSYHYGE